MTKWCAIIALALAILVKLTWHSSIALAFPLNATTHRGYPISSVLFWTLLAIAIVSTLLALVKHAR